MPRMDRQDAAAAAAADADADADDETIPDSFFDFDDDGNNNNNQDEADGASEDGDSSSDDGGDASEVENDMLESIFGDLPQAAGATSDAAKVDEAEDASASDNSEDERKIPATAAKKGANGSSAAAAAAAAHLPKSTKATTLAPDVREAGRKARVRLEEERSKRKEIRRIDDDAEGQDLLIQKNPGAAGTNVEAHKKSKGRGNKGILWMEPARKKRRRPTKAAASAVETTTKEDGQSETIVDPWLPNSSSVNVEGRSNLVRVHGLPYGCKPEEIRRFFTGLNSVKVFVLASYHHHIDGWDCIGTDELFVAATSKGKKRQRGSSRRPIVKRYAANFRVFVQFESTPGADQALKRSGETIMTSNGIVLAEKDHASESDSGDGKDEDEDIRNDKQKKNIRAAVFISPVAKIQATFLKKRLLAIDGVKGKALHEVVDDVEERLPQFVRRTIWAFAGMKLRQAIQPTDSDDDDSSGDAPKVADAFAILERRKNTSRPKDADSYRLLAIAYNSLCDLYAFIEDRETNTSMALFRQDPTLFEDPVCRLTDAALELIASEAERIDLILRWARETLVGNLEPSGSTEKKY
mmetsp:Transcript_9619/g.26962  ORF Transcript_9619/g.26962 Transcript_9619/m.26962 type:complete len:581 (-) Transcript_9619:895-2637(-)